MTATIEQLKARHDTNQAAAALLAEMTGRPAAEFEYTGETPAPDELTRADDE